MWAATVWALELLRTALAVRKLAPGAMVGAHGGALAVFARRLILNARGEWRSTKR